MCLPVVFHLIHFLFPPSAPWDGSCCKSFLLILALQSMCFSSGGLNLLLLQHISLSIFPPTFFFCCHSDFCNISTSGWLTHSTAVTLYPLWPNASGENLLPSLQGQLSSLSPLRASEADRERDACCCCLWPSVVPTHCAHSLFLFRLPPVTWWTEPSPARRARWRWTTRATRKRTQLYVCLFFKASLLKK